MSWKVVVSNILRLLILTRSKKRPPPRSNGALEFKGPSVVVSKSPCILLEVQRKRRAKEEIQLYQINQEICQRCKTCIGRFGCPALYFAEDGSVHIDAAQCNGCGETVHRSVRLVRSQRREANEEKNQHRPDGCRRTRSHYRCVSFR